eukprot:6479848-Prymnesium_polylepis.1
MRQQTSPLLDTVAPGRSDGCSALRSQQRSCQRRPQLARQQTYATAPGQGHSLPSIPTRSSKTDWRRPTTRIMRAESKTYARVRRRYLWRRNSTSIR